MSVCCVFTERLACLPNTALHPNRVRPVAVHTYVFYNTLLFVAPFLGMQELLLNAHVPQGTKTVLIEGERGSGKSILLSKVSLVSSFDFLL